MADQKITDFSADTSPAAADLVVTAKSPFGAGSNRKVTLANIAKLVNASPTITGHATIEGVTATGATGTGNFVFSAAPTFTGTVTAPTLKTTTLFATTDGAGALVINKADNSTGVLTLNSTTQEFKIKQVGADATGYADQRSSGLLVLEGSSWNGSSAYNPQWIFKTTASSASANRNDLELYRGTYKWASVTATAVNTVAAFNLYLLTNVATSDANTAPSIGYGLRVQNTNTTTNNYGQIVNLNGGTMATGYLAFKNTSHHATTGSADFELYLANGGAAAKVFGVTAAGVLSLTGDIGATGARITKGWFADLAATAATLGAASTDIITCTGRMVLRTAGSDPKGATPGSRPAGSVGEIVYYNAEMYFCTDAATPTWKKITAS